MERFTGLLGIALILGAAFYFSTARDKIQRRVVFWGLGLQLAFALLVLRTDFGHVFQAASEVVNRLLEYSRAGSSFVFGPLGAPNGTQFGVIFAFQVLPIVIFIASLFSILYYLRVMQPVIYVMARVMRVTMGASGAEATNVAASIFMGQTEAPLTIKPYLLEMTESELFTIMVSGMAHVSGAVMAAYVLMANVEARHLLTAVIMTAPATVMLAKMFVPETEEPKTLGQDLSPFGKPKPAVKAPAAKKAAAPSAASVVIVEQPAQLAPPGAVAVRPQPLPPPGSTAVSPETPTDGELVKEEEPEPEEAVNVIEAAARGASDGVRLAINIAGMLIAFLAIIAMVNGLLGAIHAQLAWVPASLQEILGFVFAPVAWLMGVAWKDCMAIGNLLGTRLVLNEFIAFQQLGPMKPQLDPHSFTIATYALCGFANLSSIAIQVGGIGGLVEERKSDLARLGLKAVMVGSLANFMSACIAGILM